MAVFRLEQGKKKILVFDTIEEMSDYFLRKWREASDMAIRHAGRFAVALSGGKTPSPLYNSLVAHGADLPWNKTHIFLVDERFVPHNDPDSNFGMIKNDFLEKIDIPNANIHPIYFNGTALDAASKYEEGIRIFFKLEDDQTPQFDLIILGVGEDGHTASLFPNHEALSEKRRLVCTVVSRGLKNERVSLTLPIINNAKTIIFLVTGSGKAHIIREMIEEGDSRLPAFLVKPKRGGLFYLIDKEAASEIDYGRNKESSAQ